MSTVIEKLNVTFSDKIIGISKSRSREQKKKFIGICKKKL